MNAPTPSSPGASWSERWLHWLARLGMDVYIRQGRRYVQRGQIHSAQIHGGQAQIQVGDGPQTCQVTLGWSPFSDREWDQVLDLLAQDTLPTAQLLAGEIPQDIEALFQAADVALLPEGPDELTMVCSCCRDETMPCRHVAAGLYVLGQMVAEDPWILFRLRGRDRHQVLQALRRRRQGERPPARAAADASPRLGVLSATPEPSVPLSVQVEAFWGQSRALDELTHRIGPPTIRLALLRRLGAPPFERQSLEIYDRLQHIYTRVTQAALDLAYASDPDDEA